MTETQVRRHSRKNSASWPDKNHLPDEVSRVRLSRQELSLLDEAGLVSAYLAGEERAFEELVNRYRNRLFNFVYRNICDRERAEDIVQEVFVRVYRHIHNFNLAKKFTTWVYTIASNLVKNEFRNRSRDLLVMFQTIERTWQNEDRPLQFEDEGTRPDVLFRRRHLIELVEEAVAKLSPSHRQVFVLREMEGKHYEEIAVIAGRNLGPVKARLNRARNRFAGLIAPHLE